MTEKLAEFKASLLNTNLKQSWESSNSFETIA